MTISKERILTGIKSRTLSYFEPIVKNSIAESLGKNVSDLEESDYKSILDTMVDANMSLKKIDIEEIISEIKSNAEITVPPTGVKATILPGTVSQGAGMAAVPNPAPIKLTVSGNIKKGNIK